MIHRSQENVVSQRVVQLEELTVSSLYLFWQSSVQLQLKESRRSANPRVKSCGSDGDL